MRRSRWNSWSARRHRKAIVTNVEAGLGLALALLLVVGLFAVVIALVVVATERIHWLFNVIMALALVYSLVTAARYYFRGRRQTVIRQAQQSVESDIPPIGG